MNVTGKTPLISIGDEGRIWAKLETHNRTGSVKDRMIEYICNKELANDNITPGKTIFVEATSGNTGISLSSYAASIGCKCKIIMPCNMSQQRKDMMKAFGTEIIETGFNEFKEAMEIRNQLAEDPLYFSPMQFSNPLNIECHYTLTAPEIHYDIILNHIGKWSAFVHGAGTGGTMMGIKRYIDNKNLNIETILTVPAEANDKHGIQGIGDGADYLLDRSLMDYIYEIKTEDAIQRMKRFAKETGILIGISSGANLLSSERYLKEVNPSGIIVTMLCDRGERYL